MVHETTKTVTFVKIICTTFPSLQPNCGFDQQIFHIAQLPRNSNSDNPPYCSVCCPAANQSDHYHTPEANFDGNHRKEGVTHSPHSSNPGKFSWFSSFFRI